LAVNVILVIVTPAGMVPAGTVIVLFKSPPPSWKPPRVLFVKDTVVLAVPDAVKVTGVPGQTVIEPAVPFAKAVTVGPGLTVTCTFAVPVHPPEVAVYVIEVLPADKPFTTPPAVIVATAVLLLDHVPPAGLPVKVVEPPWHVVAVPEIVTVGGALIVNGTETVVTQVPFVEVNMKVSLCAPAPILVRFPTKLVVGAFSVPELFIPIRLALLLVQL
jgi:hypothetical protein